MKSHYTREKQLLENIATERLRAAEESARVRENALQEEIETLRKAHTKQIEWLKVRLRFIEDWLRQSANVPRKL